MNETRQIDVYSAGCPACAETIALVERIACESCQVTVHDMNQREVADRANKIGIRTVPAVVVDGNLAACCENRGPTENDLRAAGLGLPLG